MPGGGVAKRADLGAADVFRARDVFGEPLGPPRFSRHSAQRSLTDSVWANCTSGSLLMTLLRRVPRESRRSQEEAVPGEGAQGERRVNPCRAGGLVLRQGAGERRTRQAPDQAVGVLAAWKLSATTHSAHRPYKSRRCSSSSKPASLAARSRRE